MSMLGFLFGDAADLIQVALIFLFLVAPVIWGALSKLAQQQQQRRPGAGPPARRAPGAGPPAAPPRAGRGPAGPPRQGGLEDEIGEFLRRAAQHRQGKPVGGPRPAAAPVGRMAQEPVIEAEVVAQQQLGEGVKRHVGEYLDAEEFQRRAGELGEEVAQADEQLEKHLHAKFDHELSALAGRRGETASAPGPEGRLAGLPSTAAAGVAAMLTNPASIRQAIVINEILTRPEGRWT